MRNRTFRFLCVYYGNGIKYSNNMENINYLSHQERDVELTSIKLALSVSFAIQFLCCYME